MRTLKISGCLLGAALLWVGLLSLIAGDSGGGQSASIPATDGSRASIKFIDKAKFYVDQAGEVAVRMTIVGADQQPILGLTPRKFRITEEGFDVSLKALNGPGTQPINVILVFDISGSMRGKKIADAKDAALVALNALNVDRDRLGLIVFDNRFDVLQSLTNLTSDVKDRCRQNIQQLNPRGGTTIGPPTIEALRVFEQTAPNGLKLLLVMTDGEDAELPSHLERIAKASDAQGVPVYTIAFGDKNDRAERMLQELATICKGEYYFAPTGDELARIYRSRVQEASNEFLLAYDSPFPEADGLPRRVQIEVAAPCGTLTASDRYHIGPLITGGQRSPPKIAGTSAKPDANASDGTHAVKIGMLFTLLAVLLSGLAAPEFLPKFRSSLSATGEALASLAPTVSSASGGGDQSQPRSVASPQPQQSPASRTAQLPPSPQMKTTLGTTGSASPPRVVPAPSIVAIKPPPPPPANSGSNSVSQGSSHTSPPAQQQMPVVLPSPPPPGKARPTT